MEVVEVRKILSILEGGGGGSGIITPTSSSCSNICKYWANGNRCRHGKRCWNLHSWSDGISVHPEEDNPRRATRLVWWTAPPKNFVKINCDGAFSTFHGNKVVAAGGVMRDCDGKFITGFSSRLMNCNTVEEAELWAIHIGIEIALSMGFLNMVVESDSFAAVEFINSGVFFGQDDSRAVLVSSIRCLGNEANNIRWNHVFRDTNSVADSFAKHGLSLSRLGVKLFSFPPEFSVGSLFADKVGTIYSR